MKIFAYFIRLIYKAWSIRIFKDFDCFAGLFYSILYYIVVIGKIKFLLSAKIKKKMYNVEIKWPTMSGQSLCWSLTEFLSKRPQLYNYFCYVENILSLHEKVFVWH